MTTRLSQQHKRLAKLEQIVVNKREQIRLVNCNCVKRDLYTVADPKKLWEFEEAMNRTCPVHGFRDLGLIIQVEYESPKHEGSQPHAPSPEEVKLERLLRVYDSRRILRYFKQVKAKQNDSHQH